VEKPGIRPLQVCDLHYSFNNSLASSTLHLNSLLVPILLVVHGTDVLACIEVHHILFFLLSQICCSIDVDEYLHM